MSEADRGPTPAELVAEHRDVFEKLADSTLPISEDAERALELLDNPEEEG